jgi:multicomponent Na+:H+ antiporter subunit D
MSAIPILIPASMLLFAVLSALAGIWRPALAYFLAMFGLTCSLAASCAGLYQVLTAGNMHYALGGWAAPYGIEYVLDPLSAFIAVVITVVGYISLIFPPQAGLYEEPRRQFPMYGLVMLLLTGLLGVVVTGDVFNLFVFLEIYSLASYALVTLGGDRAMVASFRYVIMGTIAGGFYLLGIGFIYFATGSLNMADIAQILPSLYGSPVIVVAVALIVIALGIKMALFPLHMWLPDAHSYAPPVIAAILASLQIEVAAYALIRLMLSVFGAEYFAAALPVTTIIGWCSAVGIIFGSVMAIAQRNFKRMLAYSTVAQVSYIGLGIALANPLGLIGALLHILNHAFMKSCLFLVAGGIIKQTGLTEIPTFNGLGRRLPWTMAAFTMAALSMVGIPPTAGFFSKWYLIRGGIDAGNWVGVVAILLSSLLTAVYFFRILENVYAKPEESQEQPKLKPEAPPRILVPILILGAGILVLGLANAPIVSNILEQVAAPLSTLAGVR